MENKEEKLEIYEYLLKNNETITFAESCTGGMLASSFCEIPGVSSVFKGSIVAYSDEVKINNLKVKSFTINEYSAVSSNTAKEMAENAANLFNTDYAIAITGYAGPTGGTKEDPVGTFYLGFYCKGRVSAIREYCPGRTRNEVREFACECAFSRLAEIICV